ncbi:MAG: hypothetical protein NTV23_14150 [Propionibacteriales bacterium]|nr:hypothetical protein [Propionibacteriales bacterium]
MAVIAVGTGLGAEAGRGAREPIEQALSSLIGAEGVPTVVLSQPEAKPFNRSVVSKSQVDAVQEWALSGGYTAIAYRLALGDAANLSSGAHPSSASIVALPTDRVPDLRPSGSELPVMTTAQFASVGDRLSVEGHDAIVVKTVDWFPGLDRTAVVMSEAGYDELSAEPEPYSGVLVGGATPIVVQDHLSSAGIGLSAVSVRSWLNSYDRFWDRSVTPVIMQYMLAVALVGGVAASFIRTADVLRRRRQIAIHNVMGVQKAMLVRAEFLRAFLETAKATLYAALPAIGLIAVANSSQFGMNMGASLGGLGAGALLVGASMAMGTLGAMRAIRRLDAANEIR